MVRVDVTGEPLGVTLGGASVQLNPDGSPLQESATFWLNPLAGVTVMVLVPGMDLVTVTLAGLAESVNVPEAVIVTCTAGEVLPL
jgi:hypothetical protein